MTANPWIQPIPTPGKLPTSPGVMHLVAKPPGPDQRDLGTTACGRFISLLSLFTSTSRYVTCPKCANFTRLEKAATPPW